MKLGAENKKAAYVLGAPGGVGICVLFQLPFGTIHSGRPRLPAGSRAGGRASDDEAAAERAQLASRVSDEFLPALHKKQRPSRPTPTR